MESELDVGDMEMSSKEAAAYLSGARWLCLQREVRPGPPLR